MHARKLIISRGRESPEPFRPGAAADPRLVHHRLLALERLNRLREKGALSADEYEAEKALVLRVPADVRAFEAMSAPRHPSLLGRLLNMKLIAAGAAAGLALSAFTAPQDLYGLVERAQTLFG